MPGGGGGRRDNPVKQNKVMQIQTTPDAARDTQKSPPQTNFTRDTIGLLHGGEEGGGGNPWMHCRESV